MCVRPYCPILLFYSLAIWSCCSGTSKWCWSWWCHLQLPITCTTTTHADPTRPMNGSDPCQTLETWIATSKWQCRTYTISSLRRNTAVSLWYRHITTPLRVLAVHTITRAAERLAERLGRVLLCTVAHTHSHSHLPPQYIIRATGPAWAPCACCEIAWPKNVNRLWSSWWRTGDFRYWTVQVKIGYLRSKLDFKKYI